MKVRIYSRDTEGEAEELGAIVLAEGRLVAEPKVIALENLLADPLVIYEGTEQIRIRASDEPKRFLASLPRAICGSYFWAGQVEE